MWHVAMLVPMTLVASNPAGEESVAGDRQWAYPVKVRGKWGCIDRDGNVVKLRLNDDVTVPIEASGAVSIGTVTSSLIRSLTTFPTATKGDCRLMWAARRKPTRTA